MGVTAKQRACVALQWVAELQSVAVCCSALQCVAVRCSHTLRFTREFVLFSPCYLDFHQQVRSSVAVRCSAFQCVAVTLWGSLGNLYYFPLAISTFISRSGPAPFESIELLVDVSDDLRRKIEGQNDRKRHDMCYGVALVSRIDQIIGLFCKRALQKRHYSVKETYNSIDPWP